VVAAYLVLPDNKLASAQEKLAAKRTLRGRLMAKAEPAYQRMMQEVMQDHSTRKSLYVQIEKELGNEYRLVSFVTSSRPSVILETGDADMLEEALDNTDLEQKKLCLLLNSAGGDPLAAERIVRICRTFSPMGFDVIVPKMAKSAATMICMGADLIIMSRTSELGPIDPQILIFDDNGVPSHYQAAHEIIESYENLMKQATQSKGRIEPYLQQLGRFDARDIRRVRTSQVLSLRIAVNHLKQSMMKKKTAKAIENKIKLFTDPNAATVSHGRPIYHDAAVRCGLGVKVVDNKSGLWKNVWALYIRLNHVTNRTHLVKLIESTSDSFAAHQNI